MGEVLGYSSNGGRRLNRKKWIIAFVALGLIGGFALVPLPPYKVSVHWVCQECGILKHETRWWDASFLEKVVEVDTPVSKAIGALPAMTGHVHRFAFINENGRYLGGGRWCALGSGGTAMGNANDPRVAEFLSRLYATGQLVLADAWRANFLDKGTARTASNEIDALDVPFEGFDTVAAFSDWQTTHDVAGPVGLAP